MLRFLVIVLLGAVTWGSREARLGPGVVVEEDHEVWLASDQVTISVEFDKIGSAREELSSSKDRLQQMRMTLDAVENKRTLPVSLTRLLKEIRIALDRVDKGIDKTLEWVPDVTPGNSPSTENRRSKRAAPLVLVGVDVIAAIGAMSIGSLVKVAEVEKDLIAQGKQLNQLQESNKKLSNSFETMRRSLNDLSVSVEGLKEDLDVTIAFLTIQHTVLNVEKETDSLRTEVQMQVKAIIAAADGRVYGDMLPLGYLENVLRNSAYLHGAKVLFTGGDLYLYHNVSKVRLSDRGLIVYVPVSTMKPFVSFVIRPFPSAFGDLVVIWKGLEIMFILGDQYQGLGVDYKTGCTLVREKYVCDSSVFQLQVVSVGGCELSLVHRQTPTECDFMQFPREYHMITTSTLTAVFCKECPITTMCQNNQTTSFVLQGSKLFDSSCRILSTDFLALSRAVFNSSEKIFMRHMHNNHDIVPVPSTEIPMTVPKMEEIEDTFMVEYREYLLPAVLMILVVIFLIVLVMGVVKLTCACKTSRKCSKTMSPVDVQARHEGSI